MVLVWPNWFGLDHNDLVTTKMKWSWPKWIGRDQSELVSSKLWFLLVKNHNLDLTNSFWSWPFHFGHDQIIMVKSQINLVRPKPFWTDQNCVGHIEGQGINLKVLKECSLMTSIVFWPFFDLPTSRPTYHVLVPFFGAILDPPTYPNMERH